MAENKRQLSSCSSPDHWPIPGRVFLESDLKLRVHSPTKVRVGRVCRNNYNRSTGKNCVSVRPSALTRTVPTASNYAKCRRKFGEKTSRTVGLHSFNRGLHDYEGRPCQSQAVFSISKPTRLCSRRLLFAIAFEQKKDRVSIRRSGHSLRLRSGRAPWQIYDQANFSIFGSALERDTYWELAGVFRACNSKGKMVEVLPALWSAPKNRPNATVVGSDEAEQLDETIRSLLFDSVRRTGSWPANLFGRLKAICKFVIRKVPDRERRRVCGIFVPLKGSSECISATQYCKPPESWRIGEPSNRSVILTY